MIDSEVEMEIKIEYFESFEDDPLTHKDHEMMTENYVYPIKINKYSDEIKKEEFLRSSTPINDEKLIDHENDEHNEYQSDSKWHKLIDKYGKYMCKFCDLTYSTVQTLRYHVKIKHASNYHEIKDSQLNQVRKCRLKCHICNLKFTNIFNLQEHSRTHGLNNTNNICFICQATFKEQTELAYHMANKHGSFKKKLHICSICGYSTTKAYHFKQHINTHTNNYKVKCVHCPYSTNRLSNLKIHKQIHYDIKSYVCDSEACDYRCSSMSALRSHKLMHNKEKYMLYCDKCNYSTVYSQNLKKHIDSHKRNKVRIKL